MEWAPNWSQKHPKEVPAEAATWAAESAPPLPSPCSQGTGAQDRLRGSLLSDSVL